jgi:phage repressor protein C with HTH and peptisase S24 domain
MGTMQYILYRVVVNTFCVLSGDTMRMMTTIAKRLEEARTARRLETPTDAWRAMDQRGLDIARSSYISYENGNREPGRKTSEALARFYRVNLEWLLTGRGEMSSKGPSTSTNEGIEIVGLVGAGEAVEDVGETSVHTLGDDVTPFSPDNTVAYVIRGDSMYPRFFHGEIVLAERHSRQPNELIGQYAIIQTSDGRRLLKVLKRGSKPGLFNLWSHNIREEEEDVRVVNAQRYLACIAAPPATIGLKRRGPLR